MKKPEVILALDVDSAAKARELVRMLMPEVRVFKVGMQLFTAAGPGIIRFINARGGRVFLDLKFFDIPHTVASAVRQAVRLNTAMLTLHILGDEEMIRAAVAAADDEAVRVNVPRPLLFGVTVLTSREAQTSDVVTLAGIGLDCGLDGVVCSAREAPVLRKKIKKYFFIVTPGIRPAGSRTHDQKRTATVEEAVRAGSNFLVVGRPILEAADPKAAALRFMIP